MNYKSIIRPPARIAASFLAALAAVTSFSAETNYLPDVFSFYRQILSTGFTNFLFFFVLLLLLSFSAEKRCVRSTPLFELCCAVLAGIWLLGRCFAVDDTLDCLMATNMQRLRSLIYLLGSYLLLRSFGLAVISFLHSGKDLRAPKGKVFEFYDRHSFLCFFILILLCSVPTLLSCYPGYMCSDSYCQLAYYFGIYEFVAHHPTIHTLFISYCVKLGIMLGNADAGLYIIVCIQFLCFASVFAYRLSTMRSLSSPRWLILLSFLLVILCPAFLPVAAVIVKDNVFGYAVLLLLIEVIYMRRMGFDYLKYPRHILLFSIAVAGTLLMRNNGKYLLLLFFPVLLLVYFIKAKREKTMRSFLLILAVFIVPCILSAGLEKLAINAYDVAPGSRREAFSLPFQQTARYAFEHGDEVTDEERGTIDKVLQYQYLAEDYWPMCSDNSKCYYVEDSTNAELLDYFGVWFSQGMKHPATYFKATMNQNYPLFCPFRFGTLWRGTTESSRHTHISEPLGLHDVEFCDGLHTALSELDRSITAIPVVRLFNGTAVYTLLTLLLCVFALHERNWEFLLIALPGLISLLIVFAAPLVEIRYAFPVAYTMPLVTAYYIYSLKKA